MENVCKFVPINTSKDVVNVINFVYEKQNAESFERKISSVYRINYVIDGNATVTLAGQSRKVRKGDVFFIIPAVPYLIESSQDFKYIYISFFGTRANMVLERLGVSSKNFVFEDFSELDGFFKSGLNFSNQASEFAYEGILTYAIATIGNRVLKNEGEKAESLSNNKFLAIKKYIDDHFSDAEFSLERLSQEFSYNKKYLSSAFKKFFKIGIVEYVNTIRINQACALISLGYTSVSDIAYLCGFDDPLYFSRLFKKKMKISPKESIKNLSKR